MPAPPPAPSDNSQPNGTIVAANTDTAAPTAAPKATSSDRQQPTSRSGDRSSGASSTKKSASTASTTAASTKKAASSASADTASAKKTASTASTAKPTATPNPAVIAAVNKVRAGSGVAHGSFIWPAAGVITQGFWAWEWGHRHGGLDIANSAGTPLVAADGGTVVSAGWNVYGFGYCVVIDHGNGFKTLYGHMMHQPAVWAGEKVSRGQYIGPMGSTGNSTGPHVHFAIYYNGILRDPLNYLG